MSKSKEEESVQFHGWQSSESLYIIKNSVESSIAPDKACQFYNRAKHDPCKE